MQQDNRFRFIPEKFLFLGIAFVGLLPISPLFVFTMRRDSGVFQYIGWRILNGEVPYRDIWDHKPPIIFFLNALGLWLGNLSPWGIWFIEFLSLAIALFLCHKITSRIFDVRISYILMVLFTVSFGLLIMGGNFTNEYTLPLQFLAVMLTIKIRQKDSNGLVWFFLGVAGGAAFFTKQTSIGIWISIVFYYLVKDLRERVLRKNIKTYLNFTIGFLVVTCFISLYFVINQSFSQFINAAFIYNFYHAELSGTLLQRVSPLVFGMGALSLGGLLLFGITGGYLSTQKIRNEQTDFILQKELAIILLIDLVIELFLIITSPRGFLHYYLSILPVLTILSGVTLQVVFSSLKTQFSHHQLNTLAFVISIVMIWGSLGQYKLVFDENKQVDYREISEFIMNNTGPSDNVLIYGGEAAIHMATKRVSPSRFVYLYPLYQKDYVTQGLIIEFLDDVLENKPKLLMYRKDPILPYMKFPIMNDVIIQKIDLINSRYKNETRIDGWQIYKYILE